MCERRAEKRVDVDISDSQFGCISKQSVSYSTWRHDPGRVIAVQHPLLPLIANFASPLYPKRATIEVVSVTPTLPAGYQASPKPTTAKVRVKKLCRALVNIM